MQTNSERGDIALVSVEKDLPVQASIPTVNPYDCDENSPLLVAGYGANEDNLPSPLLKIATYQFSAPPTEPNWPIYRRRANPKPSNQNAIFMKANNGRMCPGDSGGPVFCKANGRIALLGINNAISNTSRIHRRLSQQKLTEMKIATLCLDMPFGLATTVSKSQPMLDEWSKQLDGQADANVSTGQIQPTPQNAPAPAAAESAQ
jgi:hypothetical protein